MDAYGCKARAETVQSQQLLLCNVFERLQTVCLAISQRDPSLQEHWRVRRPARLNAPHKENICLEVVRESCRWSIVKWTVCICGGRRKFVEPSLFAILPSSWRHWHKNKTTSDPFYILVHRANTQRRRIKCETAGWNTLYTGRS